MDAARNDIIIQLKKEILSLQGFKNPVGNNKTVIGPAVIQNAFPNACFPTGAIHEFVEDGAESSAASNGFIAGMLGQLMQRGGPCVWISTGRTIFPPALKSFGVLPEQIIFIDVRKEKEVLWVMEEVLKCEGIASVVGEIQNIDFTASRRLQLAAEQSRVTGFIVRRQTLKLNTIACVARWKVFPLSSALPGVMPGVGFPRWKVVLEKIRNGVPGEWDIEWIANAFHEVRKEHVLVIHETRKAG
jgi:protein ImuA